MIARVAGACLDQTWLDLEYLSGNTLVTLLNLNLENRPQY